MKKTVLILISLFITSCASNGRVCGGAGGKRCVEIHKKSPQKKYS